MIDPGMRTAYRSLEARLRPFVARRVASSADVDDVVQEVFLRMQRGLPALRNDDSLGAWVYQVARNAIVDHRRAHARDPVLLGDEAPETEADDDDRKVEQNLALYVAPFVAMLPSPYREALTLTELEGITQKEAARMLGISLSGMKSRVQRGRARLRALLEACCEIAVDARGGVVDCTPRPGAPCGACEPRQG